MSQVCALVDLLLTTSEHLLLVSTVTHIWTHILRPPLFFSSVLGRFFAKIQRGREEKKHTQKKITFRVSFCLENVRQINYMYMFEA